VSGSLTIWELRLRTNFRLWVSALILLTFCDGPAAQQVQSQLSGSTPASTSAKPNSFELDKENSNHVAASPAQIRALLVKDPGLLVELKHIVSKEATLNGQVVDDTDLTDQAIFDRLDESPVFRAQATRLLQRFGYLLPSLNPDSDLGKQQELLQKERARRLVQIETQEDAESSKPSSDKNVQNTVQRVANCDPRRSEDCNESEQQRSRRRDSEQNPPAQSIPGKSSPTFNGPPSSSTLLRAGMNSDPSESFAVSLKDPSDSTRLASLAPSRDLLFPRSYPPDGVLLPDALSNAAPSVVPQSNRDQDASTFALRASNSSIENRRRATALMDSSNSSYSGAVLHKQNPYADVPSLYDLYVQVAPRERSPERFGISVLSQGLRQADAVPMDLPVGPDYVVGPGDSLAIDLWGGVSQRMLRVVDRQGRIALPEAGPLLVSGKTLGEVQSTVQQALRSEYRDASADVSLARLRTIRVYVVGEVTEPGAYDISSLSTPLNALVAAGGVTQRASLRSLKHYRGKQLIEVVDAYDLLLRGVGTDEKRLESGDSLLVPLAGPQVTIEGMVRRPAIYELSGETTLEDALELAGGLLPAAALQHVEVERLVAHQKRTMFSLDLVQADGADAVVARLSGFYVQDGDHVRISPIAPYSDQAIYLQGHVLKPGRYSYREGMKFNDLITSYSDLLPEPAGRYAEIIRLNPPDFRPTVESFDLTAALGNPESAPRLKPLDTVRIFSRYDFESAPDVWIAGEVREPGLYETSGQIRFRDALYLAGGVTSDAALDSAQLFRASKDGTLKILSVNLSEALAGNPADNLPLQPHDRIIIQRNAARVDPPTVYVRGEVAKPGRYPLTSNMRVEDLVRVAGGLKRSADSQSAILTHQQEPAQNNPLVSTVSVNLASAMTGDPAADPILGNGDVLSIRQAPGWGNLGASVTIRGEVVHPGTFGIYPGESLASVLVKAGGFTTEAYPYGTILTRREVRDLELKTHDELVARVKAEVVELKSLPENDADQKNAKLTALAQTDTTLTQLQAYLPIGRVVIQSTQDLKTFEKAASATPLRNGDVVAVPKKANYVLVNGQVFNATAIGYIPERSAKWYLGQAGGLTQLADKNAVFVLRANGSVLAAKNNSGIWAGDPLNAVLLPGDAIVVPEKAPKIGNRNWAPLIQSAQVATSIALAIAYLKP
jgi:protein involved in polysaccharide export with SLBB domain